MIINVKTTGFLENHSFIVFKSFTKRHCYTYGISRQKPFNFFERSKSCLSKKYQQSLDWDSGKCFSTFLCIFLNFICDFIQCLLVNIRCLYMCLYIDGSGWLYSFFVAQIIFVTKIIEFIYKPCLRTE